MERGGIGGPASIIVKSTVLHQRNLITALIEAKAGEDQEPGGWT